MGVIRKAIAASIQSLLGQESSGFVDLWRSLRLFALFGVAYGIVASVVVMASVPLTGEMRAMLTIIAVSYAALKGAALGLLLWLLVRVWHSARAGLAGTRRQR